MLLGACLLRIRLGCVLGLHPLSLSLSPTPSPALIMHASLQALCHATPQHSTACRGTSTGFMSAPRTPYVLGCATSVHCRAGRAFHLHAFIPQQVPQTLTQSLTFSRPLSADLSAVNAGAVCVDPMCGSGTLLIEAALIATATAPGLLRDTREHALHHALGSM